MPYANGRITAPVGVDSDVPQALGISNTDVGYQCSNLHGKTNKWAKYKPMKHESVADLTEEYKRNINYGMTYTESTSVADIVNLYIADEGDVEERMNGWNYQAPDGSVFSAYRATDWEGYYSNASNPVMNSAVSTKKVGNNVGYKLNANGFISLQAEGQLTLADMFGNRYLGVCIWNSNSNYYYRTMNNNISSIANGGYSIDISTEGVISGVYKIFPIICLNPCVWDGDARTQYAPARPSSQRFVALPNVKIGEVEIVEGSLQAFRVAVFRATWGYSLSPVADSLTPIDPTYNYNCVNVQINITDIQEDTILRRNWLYLIRGGIVVDSHDIGDITYSSQGMQGQFTILHTFNVNYAMGYQVRLVLNNGTDSGFDETRAIMLG